MSYDLARRKQEKMREIERRIQYMKAASPPKDLLRATSRNNIIEIQNSLSGARSATSIGEQMIQKGILDNQYYKTLKDTIHKPPLSSPMRSPSRTPSYYEQQGTPSSSFSSSFDSSSFFAPQTEERVSSRTGSRAAEEESKEKEIDWSQHPMVRELGNRGLTSAASKRKLQANVKREVQNALAAAEASKKVANL